jgi:hypothetical protein
VKIATNDFDQKCKELFFALQKGGVLCRNLLFFFRFAPKVHVFARFLNTFFSELAEMIERQNAEFRRPNPE